MILGGWPECHRMGGRLPPAEAVTGIDWNMRFASFLDLDSSLVKEYVRKLYIHDRPLCRSQIEVVLADGTRCDCVTDTHAIEFVFGSGWAESIGQAYIIQP